MDASTPRITFEMLQRHVGQNVMIVGKVMQIRGEDAIIDANGEITAHLNREAHLSAGNGCQVIGKVNQDCSVKVLNSIDLGPSVDYSLANAVVDVSHKYPALFGNGQ